MDSKITRSFKPKRTLANPKPDQPQPLKKQTNKIQNKLQFLKAQIAMRKTMKIKQKQSQVNDLKTTQNKNNTGQSWNNNNKLGGNTKHNVQNNNEKINKFLLSNTRSNFMNQEINEDRQKLENLLISLKMDQLKQVISQKYGVTGLQKLLTLTQQDIDNWKNIPVGFRVKMRKFIHQHNKQNITQDKNSNKKQLQIQEKQAKQQDEDIEKIIQRRKNLRIYQPICDIEIQQDDPEQNQRISQEITQKNQQNQQQGQDQQDILISSLNSAFLQRRGIIKKQGSSHDIPNRSQNKMKVHWDKQVKEYSKQTSVFKGENYNTKYPTTQKFQQIESIGDEGAVDTNENIKRVQYCWNCLKKIEDKKTKEESNSSPRNFCGIICSNSYQSLIKSKSNKKNAQTQQKIQQIQQKNVEQEQQQNQIIDFDLDLL